MPIPLAVLVVAAVPLSPVESRIAERLLSFEGVAGVAAKNLDTGETILVNADTRFPTASTIKTAVMVEVLHQIREERIRRDQLLTLTEAVKVGEPVVLNRLHAGLSLTVMDLVSLMITASDNTATNLLVDLVGTTAVDKRLAGYGLQATRLYRPTFRDGRPDVLPEEEREFGLGSTTPREMALLMELIAEGKVVSREASEEMMAILEEQHDRAILPRLLPLEQGLRVGNKTGEDLEKQPDAAGIHRYVRGDAAIVRGPGLRYVVAFNTRQGKDTRSSVDNDAAVTGGAVARMIHDHFCSRPPGLLQ